MKNILVLLSLILVVTSIFAEEVIVEDVAIFAGGCFWCIEKPFDDLYGVQEVVPGYTGGNLVEPGYEKVSSGTTKHREAIRIKYDPQKISYTELLDMFLKQIDPSDGDGQFADRGLQYSPAVFYRDDNQKNIAEKVLLHLSKTMKVDIDLIEAKEFYVAEDYHHKYYKSNPDHYDRYYKGSGRGPYLDKKWKGYQKKVKIYIPEIDKEVYLPKVYKTKKEWREKLSAEVYHVTEEKGTEKAGTGDLLFNKEHGIYRCIRCNNALFRSEDKYESGTGWPSFTQAISGLNIKLEEDNTLFMKRIEILCSRCNSHLGHVFADGPIPSGKRYCINSLSLKFQKTKK